MSDNNKNNGAPREQALSIAEGAVEDDDSSKTDVVADDQPIEKPNRLWLWIGLFLVVVVVAVAIAVPVSIHLLNRTAESEPTIWPRTPEGLAGLIQSRLPSVSFDNTTSPESRALEWLAKVDTSDQGTLSDDRLVQRFAMAAIGMSINGLSNWFTSGTECSWGSGQMVCNSLGEVNQIDAEWASLSGSIPVSIGLLTSIDTVNLFGNSLTGSIPSEVGGLTALTELVLHGNHLTGTIPSKVGGLTALRWLDLSNNILTGMIPSELGGLTSMSVSMLFTNQLIGTIPSEVGKLSALEVLHIYDNNLTGKIPSEVGALTRLRDLGLDSNALTGTIPSEMGGLTSLWFLDLFGNQLTGTMPDSVCERVPPRIDCGEIVCDCCQDTTGKQCP